MNEVLRTERLLLRRPEPGDVDDFLELLGDPEVVRWLGGETADRAGTVESVERWIGRWERNGVGQFAVLLEGRVIGRVGLLVWDARSWITSSYEDAAEHARSELGWALARREWGNGYATEAARTVRDWARTEHGIGALISLIAPENVRSQRVAEKLGARAGETVATPHGPARVWHHPDQGQAPAR